MGKRADRERSEVPYTIYVDRGIATLNARIRGRRHRPSLGIAYDPATASPSLRREVEAAAARAYGQLVDGRVVDAAPEARVLTAHRLDELGGLWLEEAERLWPDSVDTRATQLGNVIEWATHAPRFGKDRRTPLERLVDDVGPEQYAMDRLGEVLRDTVTKELSNLYRFFEWCVRERHIAKAPPRPVLPRGLKGKRSGPQRAEPVDVTYEEAIAICEAMPEYTRKGGRGVDPTQPIPKGAIVVRDVYRLAWELALRPGDVATFAVPRHWMPGQTYVAFRGDDKTSTDDRIPLTRVALEILERHAPERGVIFGEHDLRVQVKRAAIKVLGEERGQNFSDYDFRHARLTYTVEVTGDLMGAAALARHKRMTTTNRYVRAKERHVAAVVAALDGLDPVSTRSGTARQTPCAPEPVTVQCYGIIQKVRRAGLEPARCYPLAPQRLETERFCGFSLDRVPFATPQDAVDRQVDHGRWSGSGQDVPAAVLRARQGLGVLRFQEQNLDAFVLSAIGVVAHEGVQ